MVDVPHTLTRTHTDTHTHTHTHTLTHTHTHTHTHAHTQAYMIEVLNPLAPCVFRIYLYTEIVSADEQSGCTIRILTNLDLPKSGKFLLLSAITVCQVTAVNRQIRDTRAQGNLRAL